MKNLGNLERSEREVRKLRQTNYPPDGDFSSNDPIHFWQEHFHPYIMYDEGYLFCLSM